MEYPMYGKILLLVVGGVAISACQTTPLKNQPVVNPPGCRFQDMGWQDGSLVINADGVRKQRLYIFHNRLTLKSIVINHNIPYPSMSACWASELKAEHWTALAADKNHFVLSCYQNVDKRLKLVDCQTALQACQMVNAHFTVGGGGTYWVEENQVDYPHLQDEVRLRGVYW